MEVEAKAVMESNCVYIYNIDTINFIYDPFNRYYFEYDYIKLHLKNNYNKCWSNIHKNYPNISKSYRYFYKKFTKENTCGWCSFVYYCKGDVTNFRKIYDDKEIEKIFNLKN